MGTIQLVKLLEEKKSCNFYKFLEILGAEMDKVAKKVHPDINMFGDLDGSIIKPINFYMDKRNASKLLEKIFSKTYLSIMP